MSAPEAQAPPSVTYREVLELLRTFKASGWTGMTLEMPGMRITAGRHGPPSTAAAPAPAPPVGPSAATPAPAPPAPSASAAPTTLVATPSTPPPAASPPAPAAVDTTGCVPVRSPAVGSFWVAPSPGAPPFVEAGQSVAEGDQLAIVEVMKLMNPVTAPQAGQVIEICAANAELVEYDQVLFMIRPAGG